MQICAVEVLQKLEEALLLIPESADWRQHT
jgi:hypothetical protein